MSDWLNHQRSSTRICPVSDSVTALPPRTSADPVSKKRTGVRSSSTLCLMVSSSSGTRWTSSIVTGLLIAEIKARG